MNVTPSRVAAIECLKMVMDHKEPSDSAFNDFVSSDSFKISRLDRALAKEILFGSLRRYSTLSFRLQKHSNRQLSTLDPEVRSSLIVGAYQLDYMDRIPTRSAVNESVEYVKSKNIHGASGFVNAILRKYSKTAKYPSAPKPDNELAYLAYTYSHPKWLIERWMKQLKKINLLAILESNNHPPKNFIRINAKKLKGKSQKNLIAEINRLERVGASDTKVDFAWGLKKFPNLEEKESYFNQGSYSIQNISSQLVGHMAIPDGKDSKQRPKKILDVCSGLGGKLASMMERADDDTKFVAIEPMESRIEKSRENLERLALGTVEYKIQDFLEWSASKDFEPDLVLIDSPCSGLGIVRKYPEGKWQKNIDTILKFAKIQKKLLLHAIEQVQPGTKILYCVCSFELEESLQHFKHVRDSMSEQVKIVDLSERLPGFCKKFLYHQNQFFQTFPGKDGMDGFSAFMIERI